MSRKNELELAVFLLELSPYHRHRQIAGLVTVAAPQHSGEETPILTAVLRVDDLVMKQESRNMNLVLHAIYFQIQFVFSEFGECSALSFCCD